MMTPGTAMTVGVRHPRRLNALAVLTSLTCVAVIAGFHGHTCEGDGCMFCLAAAIARGVLGACVGVAMVWPTLMAAVAGAEGLPHIPLPPWRNGTATLAMEAEPRVEPTPVTMGVRLLI